MTKKETYQKNLPDWLQSQRCFGLFGSRWNDTKGKYDKWPINAKTGKNASVSDPTTWSTFAEALTGLHKYHVAGIGIFLTLDLGITCLDVDHVLDRQTGQPLPNFQDQVKDILEHSENTYLERSMSGNGFHLLFKGRIPGQRKRHNNCEMYSDKRFISLTTDVIDDRNEIKTLSEENVDYLYQHYIEPNQPKQANQAFVDEGQLTLSDQDLVAKAKTSHNGEKFDQLMAGKWHTAGFQSQSEADLSLCSLLAFWTNGNAKQIDRIFRQSGLMREKWDEQHDEQTYGQMTISRALEAVTDRYNPDLEDLSWTDRGVRNRFLKRFGKLVKYSYQQQAFLYFDGKVWIVDSTGQVNHWLDNVVNELKKELPDYLSQEAHLDNCLESNGNEASSDSDRQKASEEAQKNFEKFVHHYQNTAGKTAVLKQAKAYCTSDDSIFDRKAKVINCDGTLYNLEDGTQRPVVASDNITRLISATPQDATTPVFNQFMQTVFKAHPELIKFVLKVFGYALTGTNQEQTMFILYGPGSNGKSVLLSLMSRIFGDYATQISPAVVSHNGFSRQDNTYNDQLARVENARMVTTSELEKGAFLAEATVKQLTGGERIVARPLRERSREFMPKAVLFMTTNYLPTVTGSDNGIWRRIVPIPMTTVIKDNETDPAIGDKLFAERNGILYQLIQAAKDYQQHVLQIPTVCENARQQYRSEMDTVKQFLDDVADITNNPDDKVSNRDLYNAFDRWNADVETHLTHQGLSKEL